MRVVFLGNAPWSVPSLEELAGSHHEVGMVLTRIPRPARRGGDHEPTPVAATARRAGLPLMEVETVRSGAGLQGLTSAAPDVLVVVAYGEILPGEVLAIPRVAPVNLHFSLLPRLRGAAPVQRAILSGLTRTGVTTIRMDDGMDTGPILLQREEPIGEEEDAGALGDRLAVVGGRLLVETIDALGAGDLPERPQDHSAATYAPKLTGEDRWIGWDEPSEQVLRRVRAMSPEPVASTTFRGKVLKVFRASHPYGDAPTDALPAVGPGVMHVAGEELFVDTGTGMVRLEEVAPEGSRRMTAAEFLRGHRPKAGEILG